MKITNSTELRKVLLLETARVHDGKATACRLNAMANASNQIIGTVLLEAKYAQMRGAKFYSDFVHLDRAPVPDPVAVPATNGNGHAVRR